MYVGWIGLKELVRRLRIDWQDRNAKDMHKIAKRWHANIIEKTPKKTGLLAQTTYLNERDPYYYEAVETQEYGKIQRAGSRAHPIYPRVKKALWWPGLDYPISHVPRHPGFKANLYLEQVEKEWMNWIPDELEHMLDNITMEIVG